MRTAALRRRRAVLLAAAALALLCRAAPAAPQPQSISPDPDPGTEIAGEAYVDYVGRYGEVFKLRGGWQIVPSMHGATEVLTLYPELDPRLPVTETRRLKPRASDFVPENFSPMSLIQLLIIPRDSSSFRSLAELKAAKIADLRASGTRFRILDNPPFPLVRGRWPDGTFEARVEAPYRLTQLYVATPSYLCILTSGVDAGGVTDLLNRTGDLRYGLAEWLAPTPAPVPDESPSAIVSRGLSPVLFTLRGVWAGWAAILGLALLLVVLGNAGGWDAPRRAGISLLGFAHAGALAGAALGLACWPFVWFVRHFPIVGALASPLIPALALAVGRIRGRRAPRRALIGTVLWSVSAAVFFIYASALDWGALNPALLPSFGSALGFVLFAVGGLLFGLLDSAPASGGGSAGTLAAVCLILLLPSPVRSEPAAAASSEGAQEIARRRLQANGVTPESLRKAAVVELKKSGTEVYDYQRVEIRGILSPDSKDNDTNWRLGPLFDLMIAPTHLDKKADPNKSRAGRWFESAKEIVEDLDSLSQDAQNQISSAAEAAVMRLHNKDVNEIVAHSWGTEIVYNAILTGRIRPPKRLIVCGMPDRDLEKWRALARHTGTDVVVYTNPDDPVAGGARAAGAAAEATDAVVLRNPPSPAAAKFERQWEEACRRVDCNPTGRAPGKAVMKDGYKGGTHDRFKYYYAMQDAHDLPTAPIDESLTKSFTAFPGSCLALRQTQEARVEREEKHLYRTALNAETQRVTKASGDDPMAPAADQAQELIERQRSRYDFLRREGPAGDAARNARQSEDDNYTAWLQRLEHEVADAERTRQKEKEEREFWLEMRRLSYGFGYLSSAAGLACSDESAFLAEVRSGNYEGFGMERKYLSTFLTMVSPGHGVTSCQMELLQKINDSDATVSWAALADWGRQYREAHPTFLQRLEASLRSLRASRQSFSARGRPERGGEERNGDRREREVPERSHGHPNEDTPSAGQLRGIAAGTGSWD